MIWIELRKARRSKLPLWTAAGSMFMPLGIAFLIFVSRNPDLSRELGLISAKANLMAYSAIDWPGYLGMFGQIMAAGGFIFFVLIIGWVFGREFADGTLKDMLAVPVQRSSIVLAKFLVTATWSAVIAALILVAGLITGALIDLPGGSADAIVQGCARAAVTAALTIVVVMPFAVFASVGRGYLLPIGAAILTLIMANVLVLSGWGEYFAWAVPGLHAQEKSVLAPVSYGIVALTGLAGVIATCLWWKHADQNR
jgi:ABC-2 type transport system permease protein